MSACAFGAGSRQIPSATLGWSRSIIALVLGWGALDTLKYNLHRGSEGVGGVCLADPALGHTAKANTYRLAALKVWRSLVYPRCTR